MKPGESSIAASDILSLKPDGSPDWGNHPPEVHCPMCEYNLFGLAEKRCPECGYPFEWTELLDAKRRPHPYLFEHHPESNFKSFWKTAIGELRPWKFWRGLHPAMPSKPRRLLLYYLLVAMFGCLILLTHFAIASTDMYFKVKTEREPLIPIPANALNLPQNMLDALLPLPPNPAFFQWLLQTNRDLLVTAWLVGIILLWPWLTFATLMIFQISMRKAKVRSIHVLRSTIYSYDFVLFAALAAVIVVPLRVYITANSKTRIISGSPFRTGWEIESFKPSIGFWDILMGFRLNGSTNFEFYGHLLAAILLIFSSLKLAVAYRHYLKFDWPFATVFVTQFILVLALFILVVRTGMLR